ncbi:PadR family transcriptional regulator [Chloroflexi bacterium TSY]|nr:PadR family transcriptional regulator [Chloroflexi bacterium TSY]
MERKLLLLGLLRNQEMHGYRLNEHLESQAAMPIRLKKPTAYNLLAKMEQDGWVTFRVEQEGNRPPRRVYEITTEGEEAFQALLRDELGSYTPAEFPSVVSLTFLDLVPQQEAKSLLTQRRKQIEARLDEINIVYQDKAAAAHSGSMNVPFKYMQQHYEGELKLLDELLQHLDIDSS